MLIELFDRFKAEVFNHVTDGAAHNLTVALPKRLKAKASLDESRPPTGGDLAHDSRPEGIVTDAHQLQIACGDRAWIHQEDIRFLFISERHDDLLLDE